MIEFVKLTVEEVLKKSFRDDPQNVTNALKAVDSLPMELTHTFTYSVPTKYAKAILKEYINENLHN